jgi:transposase-like protein
LRVALIETLPRRKFTREFKESAIRRVELGATAVDAACACGVSPKLLRRWRRELGDYGSRAFPGCGNRRAMAARKSQTVIFRLTDDEYRRLQSVWPGSAARSLPDYARGQVLQEPAETSLAFIDQKLDRLTLQIRRLVVGWLGGRDSNPDTQIQSLQSYH